MKLMIEIPEEFYKTSCETGFLCWEWMSMLELTNAIKNGTPLDNIISQIEQARDKDKIAEYPYNRCIEILRRAMK